MNLFLPQISFNKTFLSFILIINFLLHNQDSFSQHIVRPEMLGRPTNNGVSIKAIFDSVVEVRASFGTVSGALTNQTSWQNITMDSVGDAVAIIQISNLTPSTKYYYELHYRKPGNTLFSVRPEHSFHTARTSGETFTFTIQADPHLDASSDSALYRLCLKNQLEDNPDFMLDLGDFLMTDKLKDSTNHVPQDTIPYRCKLLRSFYESVNHSVPLFIANGNHEGEAGWYQNGTANNIAIWDNKYRKKYFMNPVPDNFYSGDTTVNNYIGQRETFFSWQWGDALFIVIDPYWYTAPKPDSLHGWRWSLGELQYKWLKTTLENSTATFKFVFSHQLVGGDKDGRGGIERANYYEWGGLNVDSTYGWTTNRPGWYKPIKQLLEENHVNVFFHGHDHLYAKQDLDCMIYQEVPQPSLPIFNGVPQATDYGYVNGTILNNSGHLRVTVSPTDFTVDYVRAFLPWQETTNWHNKDISDSYTIGSINCYDTLSTHIDYENKIENGVNIFPNPAGNNFTIQLNAGVSNAKMLFEIYDSKGSLIKQLSKIETTKNGFVSVNWDATNAQGDGVSTGIYYCKIITNTSCINKKIILVR